MNPPAETLTMAQVLQILADRDEKNLEMMKTLAAEMRKPTEIEQKKLDKEEAIVARAQQERLEQGKAEVARQLANKIGCRHSSTNRATGQVKHAWRGQVSTPLGRKPFCSPVCSQCFTVLPAFAATSDMISGGVNLSDYETLNMETLEGWAREWPAN